MEQEVFDRFYSMEPMKYYQPLDYNSKKAQDMIENADFACIATRKNDGEWGRAIIGTDGSVKIQSRTISKVSGTYGDKTELLPQLVEELKLLPPQSVVLGEICFADVSKTSKDVGAILRCLPAKAIARQSGSNPKLIFKVFDVLAWDGESLMDKTYGERFVQLTATPMAKGAFKYISLTDYVFEDFPTFLQDILAEGGEGIVIHRRSYKYTPGKRPAWTSLKVKKIVQEIELPVVNVIEPSRSYEGKDAENWSYWMGTYNNGEKVFLPHSPCNIDMEAGLTWEPITKPYYNGWKNGVVVDNKGTKVRITSGLTDDDREWLASSEAASLIKQGQLVAVATCMEITEDGSLRHPRLVRLRTDA